MLGERDDGEGQDDEEEKKRRAREFKLRGNESVRREEYEEAVRCFSLAIDLDSSNPVYFNNRAVAYVFLRKHSKALEDCKASLSLRENVRAYSRMATILCELGRLEEALPPLESALAISPGDEQSLQLRSWLASTLEEASAACEEGKRKMKVDRDYDRAIEAFTAALKLYPSNCLYYNHRAAAFFSSGRLQEGLRDCEKSLAVEENARAYSLQAAAFGELCQLDEAFRCIDRALVLRPHDKQALKTEQDLLHFKSNLDHEKHLFYIRRAKEHISCLAYDRAIEDCDAALSLCESTEAYCIKARALGEVDRLEEALVLVSKCLDTAPQDSEARQVRRDLVRLKHEREGVESQATSQELLGDPLVQSQYSDGDVKYVYASQHSVADETLADRSTHSREDCEETCQSEVEEEARFNIEAKMVEYVELYDEPSHEDTGCDSPEDVYDDFFESNELTASVIGERMPKKRSVDSIAEFSGELVEDITVPVQFKGIEDSKSTAVSVRMGEYDKSSGFLSEEEEEEEKKRRAREFKLRGNESVRREEYEEAVRCFSLAIDLDSSNPVYFNNRAVAYVFLRKHSKALEDCKASLSLRENVRAYSRMATILCELGRLEEALPPLESALAISPGDEQSLQLRSWLASTLEEASAACEEGKRKMKVDRDYDRAIEAFTAALKLYPSNCLYYNHRAAAFFSSGRLQEGLRDCEKSLAVEENARAYSLQAAAFGELCQLDEAFRCIDRALVLRPHDKQALRTEQDLLHFKSNLDHEKHLFYIRRAKEHISCLAYDRAIEDCDAALSLCESTEAYCIKARALGEVDRLEEALVLVSKCLDTAPQDSEARQVRRDLVRLKHEREGVESQATSQELLGDPFVQSQYSDGDVKYVYASQHSVADETLADRSTHSREDCEETCQSEVEEEARFNIEAKMVEYVELYDEPSHEDTGYDSPEDVYDDFFESNELTASVVGEIMLRKRSIENIVDIPDEVVEDDGVPVQSMGINFSKLTDIPKETKKLDEAYSSVAHRYCFKKGDLVSTFGLPTLEENDLSGVVVGAKNRQDKYPVFVEFPKRLQKPSETRYYYPENLWSDQRKHIMLEDIVKHPDKKFEVVPGIYLHHQYHYDPLPAIFAKPSSPSNYKVGESDDEHHRKNKTHFLIRQNSENLSIKQKTFIHSPEKYDNPLPKLKPYKSFVKPAGSFK